MISKKVVIVTGSNAEDTTKFLQAVTVAPDKQAQAGDKEKSHFPGPLADSIDFVDVQLADIESVLSKRIKDSNIGIAGILYFDGIEDRKPGGGFLGLRNHVRVTTGNVVSSADRLSENVQRGAFRTTHFDGTPASARSTVDFLLAATDNELENLEEVVPLHDHNLNQRAYEESGLTARRYSNQAVVLLAGQSGHGKSTTINRLVGRNILRMGTSRSESGSTTKVIQRVKIPVKDDKTGVEVTIAFDDSPGFVDNTGRNQGDNTSTIYEYKRRFFPEPEAYTLNPQTVPYSTFPNLILLVAEWESIIPDAHLEPEKFISPLARSMVNLMSSGLVDLKRPNVIVVITKSTSSESWDEVNYLASEEEKNIQWNVEAGKRITMVHDLQRKVFRKANLLPVVFIENGDSSFPMDAPWRKLPNGELSHQNLFDAILDVVAPRYADNADLAGIQALRLLSGGVSFDPAWSSNVKAEVILTPETINHAPHDKLEATEVLPSKLPKTTTLDIPSSSQSWRLPGLDRINEAVDEYLGVTYNPRLGKFGLSSIIDLPNTPGYIKIYKDSGDHKAGLEHSNNTEEDAKVTVKKLNIDFTIHQVVTMGSHYSSSVSFDSLSSRDAQRFCSKQPAYVAVVNDVNPRLSETFLAEVKLLPPLPPATEVSKEMEMYYDFFLKHGTHVLVRLSLGGMLRMVVQAVSNTEDRNKGRGFGGHLQTAGNPVVNFGASLNSSGGNRERHSQVYYNTTICRDGASAVASQLTSVMEKYSKDPESINVGWTELCKLWSEELVNDPVLCPEAQKTEFRWLYSFRGLTPKQMADLKEASISYLRQPPQPATNSDQSIEKNVEKNAKKVDNTLTKAFSYFSKLRLRLSGKSKKDK